MVVAIRREVTGVSMCEGAAVGVELGPSAYPSFPILPSLSPYLPIPYPTPLPTAFVWIRTFGGDPRLGAVRQVYPYAYIPSLSRCYMCSVPPSGDR